LDTHFDPTDIATQQSLCLLDTLWIHSKDIRLDDAISSDQDTRLFPHDNELAFDQSTVQNDGGFPADMQFVDDTAVDDHFT